MTVLCHMFAICCGHVPLHSPQKQALYIYIYIYIMYIYNVYIYIYTYLDPPNPRKISVFSECDLYRLSLPKTPRYYFGLRFYDFDCMFLGLVKQKLKNVCSASNDQGTHPQNPAVFFFFRVPKFLTFCVRECSAEIFPETYMFGAK